MLPFLLPYFLENHQILMKLKTQAFELKQSTEEIFAYLSSPKNHLPLLDHLVEDTEAKDQSLIYKLEHLGKIELNFESSTNSLIQTSNNGLPVPISIHWKHEKSCIYCLAKVDTSPVVWAIAKSKIKIFLEEQLKELQNIFSS